MGGVDLVIPPRGIVGLIGPNGAGKTTFFNLVTGLLRPDQGEILLDGTSLVGLRPHAIVGRGIARTFQSIRLFQNMTVLDNVLVGEHCRLRASVAGVVFRPPVVAEEAWTADTGSGDARRRGHRETRTTSSPRTSHTATSGGSRSRERSPPSRSCSSSTSRPPG